MGKVETQELEKSIKPVVNDALSFEVDSNASYQQAIDIAKEIKRAKKEVTDFFGPIKKAAHKAWKEVCSGEKKFLKPLDDAENELRRKCISYNNEIKRKREEEERHLQAEAKEKARKGRERLLKKAEKLKTPEKKEALIEEAEAIEPEAVIIAEKAPKAEGVTTREFWKAKVTDPNKVPREWLIVNEKALNQFAKATKGTVQIPGVEIYPETQLAIKS